MAQIALINELQQFLAQVCAGAIIASLAVPVAALLMRQLRWWGYSWGDDD